MMNVISALSLFAVLLYFYMGIFIYRANKVSKLNRVFMFWCLSMAAWSFGYAFVYITVDYSDCWIKVSSVGWCFFGAFALNLILLLTENALIKRPFLNICLYFPGMIFWFLSIFVFHFNRTVPKWLEIFYYFGSSVYTFIFLLLTLGILITWGLRNRSNLRKAIQAKILFITSLVASILVIITHIILPALGISGFPLLAHLFALIVLSGVFYAVKYYRLLNVSPQILNDMIFSEMLDLAFLVSPDGNIQKISRSTENLLGYKFVDLLNKPISYVLKDQNIFSDIMARKGDYTEFKYNDTQCLTKSGEILPVNLTYLPLMVGKLNEPDGFVLLGHDIRTTKQLERQIEEQKVTEELLRQSEERFRDMFYQNTAIMYMIDCSTLYILDANKAAKDYYGYPGKEIYNKKITDLNGMNEESMIDLIVNIYEDMQEAYFFKHRDANGEWRDVEIHTTPLLMDEKKVLISIVTDITERKIAEEQISYLAYHDALTGLVNRKYFYEKLHEELERSFRKGGKAAVLFLDLDDCKLINDNYGHETGDVVLQRVAKLIKSNIREIDTVARMGGDEFTLLLVDIKSRSDAEAVSEKITEMLNNPIMIGDLPVYIQASIGISIFPDDGRDMKQLLNKADNEMYAVKLEKKDKKKMLRY